MRSLITLLLTFYTITVFGQNYPFAKEFVRGTIILTDSTQKTGYLKWFPEPGEKLKFKESEKSDTKKYAPEDLMGFTADTLAFVSLFNFEMYANHYALLGKTSKIKHTFGQLIENGKCKIYFVLMSEYNPVSGGIQTYSNFLFEKKIDGVSQYAAYPFGVRMGEKKYERAKENLYIFFKDYPDIMEKIKSCKQQDNFYEVIDLIKKQNK